VWNSGDRLFTYTSEEMMSLNDIQIVGLLIFKDIKSHRGVKATFDNKKPV
jgi:hypothetical protein